MRKVIPFKTDHLFEVETNFDFPEAAKEAIASHENTDGFTICEDGRVIACGGVHIMWNGVGEGWLVMSTKAYEMPITVARCTVKLFKTIMENNDLWRIQASVHSGDNQSLRYAEWMGFENEGIMKKFGPDGSDYYRFARVV